MTPEQLGKTYAVLTAVIWAGAVVLFKRSGDRMPPLALNLFKNVIGLALLFVTVAFDRESQTAWANASTRDLLILAGSGTLGIAIADTIFFAALNLCGVGLLSIVDCVYSPCVLLFSVLLLGDRLKYPQYVGAALVISAILFAARHPLPPNRTRAQIVGGIALGVIAMSFMALGIVWATPILKRTPLVLATTVRMAAGTAALGVALAVSPDRRKYAGIFRPHAVWVYSVPAAVMGAYLSMMFWVAGFKYISPPDAAILNQTSVIFAMLLAALFLRDPLTVRKGLAITLAFSGAVIILRYA